jgi:GNAT superfamily N-acetyltransferase
MPEPTLRLARLDEAELLTELALRAKASWGYDEAFMAQCRAELTLTPEKFAAWTIWIAEIDGSVAGFAALRPNGEIAELEDFMVEPERQGRGVGRLLMQAFLSEARIRGFRRAGLDADPNAEPIYRRLGFETVGRAPSRSIPGRTLPRMEMALA